MKVTIYTKPGCGPCAATKRAMESRGIAHEAIADLAGRLRMQEVEE